MDYVFKYIYNGTSIEIYSTMAGAIYAAKDFLAKNNSGSVDVDEWSAGRSCVVSSFMGTVRITRVKVLK